MDPFTQRMLERTKMRREKLDQHFSKELELGLRQPLVEKNNIHSFSNKEHLKNEASGDIKPRNEVNSISECENLENRLLCAEKEQNSSIIQHNDSGDVESKNNLRTRPCKFGRLAELASKIKEWEDELDKPKQTTSAEISQSCNKIILKTAGNANKTSKPSVEQKKNDKQESQGYELSKNESRLMYDFERKKNANVKASEAPASSSERIESAETANKEGGIKRNCGNSPRLNDTKDSAVLKKAAFFELHSRSSPVKADKDPIELSISERKALFEKNGGEALVPKVAFATPLPAKFSGGIANKSVNGKQSEKIQAAGHTIANNNKLISSETSVKHLGKQTEDLKSQGKVKLQKEKFEKGIGSEKDNELPTNADILSREKELEHLKNRWEINKNISEKECLKIPEPPPMPPSLTVSPRVKPNVEKVETNQSQSGRLYPSLSEFEESGDSDRPATDSDSFNDSKTSNLYLNMSFSDILEAKRSEPISSNENSFNSELRESQVLSKMDEFLDNALDELSSSDYNSENENAPSPPKMMKSSSFEYKNNNEETPLNPIIHTVSFYRKQQQNSANSQTPTPVKSIKREESVTEKEVIEEEILVENKIQELLLEINKQQTIISQASQALNLCLSTVEFSGSGEQVESERLLLLANHKRQACLNEIQRLKVENSIRPRGSNQQLTEKGDVTITSISIPLKRDALRAMAAVESMQYLVCLIKCDERVVATPAVPATRDNLKSMVLYFPGQYKLENLLSDFKVTIEVYNLELNKEMLPHEVKYHIVNKKEKKLLTPIKSKKADSRLIMPNIQSPAGPNAVRSSNFHLCGYVVFSLREVSRTNWTLNKVPYTSPLEGSFSMKIQSQLQLDTEFRGFLTMFDDISGFGAWHRRWCLLSSHTLSYWKYPDDETRKIPIGTIDLRGVITENVGLVSRDICARLHTFLLETTRPWQEDDKESLVLNVQGNITKIRHLLSADSKDEMLTWCRKLNTTLALLRSWRCNFDA